MLKTIIKRLNGSAVEPLSLAEALEQLGRDRETVRADIADLNARRKQALLDDATDAELDKIERQIDRANVKLEKLTLAEAPLREQLEAARAKARAEAEPGLIAEFRAAFNDYVVQLQALAEVQRRQTEVRERAREVLGDHRAQMLLPVFVYGGFLTAEHIADWIERNSAALATAAGARPVPQSPIVTQRRPPPERPAGSTQRGVSLADRPATSHAPRAADDTSPPAAGETSVIVIRSGYTGPDGIISHAGHRRRLPREIAQKAALHGAVEILPSSGAASAEGVRE